MPWMKKYLFLIFTLILSLLAGCTTATLTPVREEGFAIYLLVENISPQIPANLDLVELSSQPILSSEDILSYTAATHEIEMTTEGYRAISALSVPVTGLSFVVCVNHQPIYAGSFWPAYSSISFDGIVIDPILATEEHPVIAIQLGYPGTDFYSALDPRSDLRILQALDGAGKLK
jgi:hypothetical protein